MTREEAKELLDNLIGMIEDNHNSDYDSALKMAIADMEKQIPKKPLINQGTRYKWIDTVRERGRYRNIEKWSNRDACPNCKKDILQTNYCEKCGQALDWGEENDCV